MIGKISIENTNRVPSKNATDITHNVNLSLEIATSHIYSTDIHKAILEDVKDGVNTHAHNNTN